MMLIKRDKIFLVCLFIISFLIRACVFYFYLRHDARYWQVDSSTYHHVATSLAQGKGISNVDGSPNFYRLPGYPVFIAFFYKLWGDNPENALWAQIFLASCIPLLVFFLANVLFPRRRWIAYGASGVSSVHLGLVVYSGFFMTESLFIFLLLCFFYYFFSAVHLWFCDEKQPQPIAQCGCTRPIWSWVPEHATDVPSYEQIYQSVASSVSVKCGVVSDSVSYYLFLAGIFLGLLSLVRPVGHYMLIVALGLLLCSRGSLMLRARLSVTLSITWLSVVATWLIRNYLLLGHIFFHTLPGGHFLYLSASRVAMYPQHCSYQQARQNLGHEVHDRISLQEKKLGRSLNEIERCYVHEEVARHYFISYPLITLKTWATDIFRTCFSLYSAELLYLASGRVDHDYFAKGRSWFDMFKRYLVPETSNPSLMLIVYAEIVLLFLLLFGFFRGLLNVLSAKCSRADVCSWIRMMPFIALFVIIALSGGYARMRLPVEPFLLMCSLLGWGTYE
ncbi:MAG: hypothetical protein WC365_06470 [Candidatus Babeliales bacterium]|jgi:4-amino-4-deoxy-L-arabinose transferase-like glycosyltransferase